MASMAFSATIPSPLLDFSQTKKNPILSFLIPSFKSSFGSSKSDFFQHGFSLHSLTVPGFVLNSRSSGIYARAATDKTLYDYTVKDIDGKNTPLSKFKGRVLLIVNVASKCGLTTSNYSELSHIYEKYKNQGFEILAFPCNQFGGQEPGSNDQIKKFACTRFKAEFPIFDKVSPASLFVDCSIYDGDKSLALPVSYSGQSDTSRVISSIFVADEIGDRENLVSPMSFLFQCFFEGLMESFMKQVDVNGPNTAPVYQFLKSSAGGFFSDLIKWNFEKFLVDKNGKVVERYPPTTSPFQIEKDIQKLLAA